jgi:hypothetical protein
MKANLMRGLELTGILETQCVQSFMPAVTMTTNFLIVALEGKRPETDQDRKGKKLHKIQKESTKEKERRGKAQQKKRKRTAEKGP